MSLKDRKLKRKENNASKHTDAVSAINQIGNVTAKGVEDNISVVKENELTPAEVAEKSRQTGEGRVKSFRENIAEALPDSAIRRRMLSKAEKKRERLDAKFGKPGNREYTSKDGNAISGDGDKMNKVAQGKSPSFLDEEGKPLQTIGVGGTKIDPDDQAPWLNFLNKTQEQDPLMHVDKTQRLGDKEGFKISQFHYPLRNAREDQLESSSIPKKEMKKSMKKYIKATKKVAKGDLREARKDRRKARKG